MSDRPAALPGNLPQSAAQSTVRRALALAAEKYAASGLSVAVCDRHGFLLAFGRTDNARPSCEERALLAHPKGFEPLTPRFVVWCSIQLSYGRRPVAG